MKIKVRFINTLDQPSDKYIGRNWNPVLRNDQQLHLIRWFNGLIKNPIKRFPEENQNHHHLHRLLLLGTFQSANNCVLKLDSTLCLSERFRIPRRSSSPSPSKLQEWTSSTNKESRWERIAGKSAINLICSNAREEAGGSLWNLWSINVYIHRQRRRDEDDVDDALVMSRSRRTYNLWKSNDCDRPRDVVCGDEENGFAGNMPRICGIKCVKWEEIRLDFGMHHIMCEQYV